MAYHVYVSNSGSTFLSHFLMDEDSGALQVQADIELGGSPGALATTADEKLLFVCLRSAKQFASYSVDAGSGALTKIGAVDAPDGAPYLKTDNTDGYLLASYYGAGHVSVNKVNDDGTLSEQPLQYVPTAGHAHSIQTDRSNQFVFVPHTNPANAIYQFRFNEQTGELTPNDPPLAQTATEEGPRHFVFHPTKDILYSVNENGCSVTAWHFDAVKGTLSDFQTISTHPEGIDMEGKSTAEIEITKDGRHLYASNRGHDTLAHFSVGEDGTLTAGQRTPCEPVPRFFAIDPTGRFVYSAGQGSGKMGSYRLDEVSGALEPMQTYEVGDGPLWITFIGRA